VTDLILAIDQGTTGSTIALMDTDGRLLTSVNHEFPQVFPQPGWVEHDPEKIWQSVLSGLSAIFFRYGTRGFSGRCDWHHQSARDGGTVGF
jgi:glycerol kinase